MEHTSAGSEAGLFSEKFRYERHRPERTLLYHLVEQHYPSLVDLMAIQEKLLSTYVRREFEEYLKWGRLKTRVSTLTLRYVSSGATACFQL